MTWKFHTEFEFDEDLRAAKRRFFVTAAILNVTIGSKLSADRERLDREGPHITWKAAVSEVLPVPDDAQVALSVTVVAKNAQCYAGLIGLASAHLGQCMARLYLDDSAEWSSPPELPLDAPWCVTHFWNTTIEHLRSGNVVMADTSTLVATAKASRAPSVGTDLPPHGTSTSLSREESRRGAEGTPRALEKTQTSDETQHQLSGRGVVPKDSISIPKKPETIERWRKWYARVKVRRLEQKQSYEKLECDSPKLLLQDYADDIADVFGSRPCTKTVSKIIKAGDAGRLG